VTDPALVAAVGLPAALAFVVALVATRLAERVATRFGLLVAPRVDRWHRQPVPLLGGIAIMAGLGAGLIGLGGVPAPYGPFLLAALAMGAIGLIDDVWTLRPQTKLVAQFVLAAVLIQLGFLLRPTASAGLNVVLTVLWVVGITNALNLLDNMDGLAASMAVIVAAFRVAFFLIDGDRAGAGVTAALLGAAAGFLVRNFPPARIFMGDAGSLFIGAVLSGVCLAGEYTAYSRGVTAVLALPVLLVLIPIFDTTFVTLSRLVTGRPVSRGGRDHTSHRLVSLGMSERRVLAYLSAVSILSGMLAVASYRYGFTYTVVLVALLLLGLGLLGVQLARGQAAAPAGSETAPRLVRLVADFPYKRHLATMGVDLVLIVVAYYAAYLLRFETGLEAELVTFRETIGPVIVAQVLMLALFGTYRGLWRYTGLRDLARLAWAVTCGVLLSVVGLAALPGGLAGVSRAVLVLDWLLLLVLLCGCRIFFRLLGEVLHHPRETVRRVLIYGAGDGGELVLRELRRNTALGREAVGFLDDDLSKVGSRIHEVPVLGALERADQLLDAHRVSEVIVASHKIPPDRVRQLEDICTARGVAVVRGSLRLE
jgi:UDP-GlcNAc:undecaprenyl-phosphate GlcNAc-1-phosphate transferase